ncbi:MAG: hypothetical protein H6591_04160 [Flavobacteriales bacterium]|nr:hypothetical protein [Flavobacteriales bacterium]
MSKAAVCKLSMELWTSNGRTRNTVELTAQLSGGRPTVVVEDIIVG